MSATAPVTQSPAPVKAKKARTPVDPSANRAKLEARIKKLQESLNAAKEKFVTETDPKIAGKVTQLKKARARLTAIKRILSMKVKKLSRLRTELATCEKEVSDMGEDRKIAQERVDRLTPEVEAAKAGVSAPAPVSE